MAEWKLFPDGTVPECTTAEWYKTRERAPHLEQPGHRERLLATAELIRGLVGDGGMLTLVDYGCGDGGLLSIMPEGLNCWGYDISPEAVAGARERGVHASLLDVIATPDGDPGLAWGDIAVCTEMLEHQVDPYAWLRRVRQHSRYLVASSPFTETDRSHYEFHTWAWDFDGYENLLRATGWQPVGHITVQSFQIIAGVQA